MQTVRRNTDGPIVQRIRGLGDERPRPVSCKRVIARAVRIPLASAVGAGGTQLATRDYLCLDLQLSDDSHGIGFTYVGVSGALTVLRALEELVIPAMQDLDASQPFDLQAALVVASRIQGRSGVVMNAISAVDIAVWDAAARRAGLPLARLLGAGSLESDAYGSGGYYRTPNGLDELDQELAQWQSLGFDRVKLKVRGDAVDSEFERIERARRSIGPDGLLMLDFYHAYESRQEASAFIEAVDAYDPYWIEDPFGPDALDSFAWLARRSGRRIATGEFQSNPVAFEHIGTIGAASVIQAEAPRCGGVSGWLRIADVADRHGMTMSPCWFHQLHAHLVPSVPNGGYVEYFHGTDVLNFDVLVDTPMKPVEGRMRLGDASGLGYGFDRDALERYTISTVDHHF